MSTSSTRRVTASFTTVEDATAYLTIEGGGKVDVFLSGISGSTILLEVRATSGATVRTHTSYTANTVAMVEFASEVQVRLRLSVDGGGTMAVALAVGQGKQR